MGGGESGELCEWRQFVRDWEGVGVGVGGAGAGAGGGECCRGSVWDSGDVDASCLFSRYLSLPFSHPFD